MKVVPEMVLQYFSDYWLRRVRQTGSWKSSECDSSGSSWVRWVNSYIMWTTCVKWAQLSFNFGSVCWNSAQKRACIALLLLRTLRAGLHHSVSVDHLSDEFHRVVQQLCSPDLSPGRGLNLLKLSQQVTGPQGSFSQRRLHPVNIHKSLVFSLNTRQQSCSD